MESVLSTKKYPLLCKYFLLLFILFPFLSAFSQIQKDNFRKFSPSVFFKQSWKDSASFSTFIVSVDDKKAFKDFIRKISRISTIYSYDVAGIVIVRSSWKDMAELIADRPEVLFIDEQRIPKEEVAVSNLDLSVNKVNLFQSRFPVYNGESLVVSVKENKPDTADIDLKERYISTPSVSPTLSSHATIMATIIAGAGNTFYQGKGVATAANISSTNFANLLPEPDSYYQQYGITVQNHSYGTDIENYYGADAMAYDATVLVRPTLLHAFSAGNSGTLASISGKYAGVSGYANLTGSFKMAKNVLTVGHIDSFGTVLPGSSKGPAYDGRVKPELVAFALDGSSGATAIVSGVGLVLQDAYKQLNGTLPSADLVKSILLNSADDVAAKGIDFLSGYGSVNAYKAMQGLTGKNFFQDSLTRGLINEHHVFIPPNSQSIKITLVWNDPPAAVNAPKALVNDLDLELVQLSTNQIWQPWVLNHHPDIDSLGLLPVRKRDSLNNVEQVSLDSPTSGDYLIRVKGVNANTPQVYAVSYQFEEQDKFSWTYPTNTDNLVSGDNNILRWESTFTNVNGQLEFSIDEGNKWEQIDNSVDLSAGFYRWQVPDTFTKAILRMNIAGQTLDSDTFSISKRMNLLVGFNCPDSLLLYWKKPAGVNRVQVYRLGERYMEPLSISSDTTLILEKNSNQPSHYAIAPLLNEKTGLRSFAINYATQGVDCYIKSFIGALAGNEIQIDLQLGSMYNIKDIRLEKFGRDSFGLREAVAIISGTSYSFVDTAPNSGLNLYRVKIEFSDGRNMYSEQSAVYYIENGDFYVFPNPVQRSQPVTILSSQNDDVRMQVYNTAGIKVHEEILYDLINVVSLEKLSRGLYFIRFIKKDKSIAVSKLLLD